MIETLISSKTRIKLLLKFFLNSNSRAYLRGLEQEFAESTNAIRVELNKFEEAGMLLSEREGNRKFFMANVQHPLFSDIQNMLIKYVGIDQIVEKVINRLGNITRVYLEGELAKGLDDPVIDLIFVSEKINRIYLTQLINKLEPMIQRHIRYVVLTEEEEKDYLAIENKITLLIWNAA